MSEIKWGSLAVGESEGLEKIKASYGLDATTPADFGRRFVLAVDGTVFALVAGDMGYDATHITISRGDILALVGDWPEVEVTERPDQKLSNQNQNAVKPQKKTTENSSLQ